MSNCLTDYFRCPEHLARIASRQPLSNSGRFFQLGASITCYGRYFEGPVVNSSERSGKDCSNEIETSEGVVYLPFDACEVVENLHRELYLAEQEKPSSLIAEMYYAVRPFLPVRARRHLQKMYFRNWDKLRFPQWPVDCSADDLLNELLLRCIRANAGAPVPFIWFWPEGASSCALMTHDVETTVGRDFCTELMDLDDAYNIKASIQVVPEQRYLVTPEFLSSIRDRGFEVVVHDLNHDGQLYKNRKEFLERASKINEYGKQYGAQGFRAGILYRNQLWYDALQFAYDMSVPNVAHLDPQRGGCCTVMPYFLGHLLELPVTTTQDYTLFNILNDFSLDLWKRQAKQIMQHHGLISVIVHPDYILAGRERSIYTELLEYLAELRDSRGLWITTPGEVNRWWRQRSKLQLVEDGDGWRIEGEGAERAKLAYATEHQGRLVFTMTESIPIEETRCAPISLSSDAE